MSDLTDLDYSYSKWDDHVCIM